MVGGSSGTGSGATTHRHRYRTVPVSDMADNDGFKIPTADVDGLSDEENLGKGGWWTRERSVFRPRNRKSRRFEVDCCHFSVILEPYSSISAVLSCQRFTAPSRNYG